MAFVFYFVCFYLCSFVLVEMSAILPAGVMRIKSVIVKNEPWKQLFYSVF